MKQPVNQRMNDWLRTSRSYTKIEGGKVTWGTAAAQIPQAQQTGTPIEGAPVKPRIPRGNAGNGVGQQFEPPDDMNTRLRKATGFWHL